jgi:hypothetical protein
LNNGHEPESSQAALLIYGKLILPERDLDATVKRLTPMLSDPGFAQKVSAASEKVQEPEDGITIPAGMTGDMAGNDPMLAQVVGIIIGSPEYQRR